MAKIISLLNPELMRCLNELGIGDTSTLTRLIIDFRPGHPVEVYAEHFGTEKVLDVVRNLSTTEIVLHDTGASPND